MGRKRGVYAFLNWFFPPRCPVCDKIIKSDEKICRNCKKELKWIKEPKCFRCGKPVEENQEYCYDCTKQEFHYQQGFSLWLYEGAAKQSVTAFKYKGRREYATFYGEELIKAYGKKLKGLNIDVIIPVPVHKERERLRGYNQAELIAKEISRALQIPMETKVLSRVRYTKPQKGLDYKQRQKNLEKAFQCKPIPCKKRKLGNVLLVDDIYTTGSTIEACAKSLLATGAAKVYFITLCIGNGL